MVKRVTRMLVAFIVALGLAMPAGVRAMPMPGATMGMAKTFAQPCQQCPRSHQTGGTTSDKMPACQGMACISAPALLPSPVLMPARASLTAVHVSPVTARLAGAAPVPDPFPPRPAIFR